MRREKLTPTRIDNFCCPPGRTQSFLWDTDSRCLAVRTTAGGAKSFVFETKLNRKTIRITLGSVTDWPLNSIWSGKGDERHEIQRGAREEASRLKSLTDQGKDPRQLAADEQAAALAKQEAQKAAERAAEQAANRQRVTVGEAWQAYIEDRRNKWSERHLFDHRKVMLGERTKGDGPTARVLKAAVLSPLAPLPLSEITAKRVADWLDSESSKRGTQAALAFRLLRAFLNWCEDQPQYRGIADPDACARKISKDHVPKAKGKNDCLQREQLSVWFPAVRAIPNVTISAYLQGLLITGARREELAGLKWSDVDFQWSTLTIRDKVEGERTIPLTPYLARLLLDLKNRNEQPPTVRRLKTLRERGEQWSPSVWVFSSLTSANGRMKEPSIAHRKAVAAAGLPPVSLHGLRRSFGTLAEWVECPVGIVAQIQGHKPSAIAEKHYRRRPLDLLRLWHTRIEAWLLEQAGIPQPQSNTSEEVGAATHRTA